VSRIRRKVAAFAALVAVAVALVAQVVMPMPLTRGPIPLAMICTAHGVKSLGSEQNPPAPGDQQPPHKQHCVFCSPAAAQWLTGPAVAVFAPLDRFVPQLGGGFEYRPSSLSVLRPLRSRAPPRAA
jgi:hypothetical protein